MMLEFWYVCMLYYDSVSSNANIKVAGVDPSFGMQELNSKWTNQKNMGDFSSTINPG